MKQEYIASVLAKTAGCFETEDSIKLQKLLQTTSDEAFPILMTLKVPVNPLLKGGLYLLAAFGVLNFIVGVYFTFFEGGVAWEESIGLIVGLVIFLIGFIPAKTIKPSKSKMYEEYSRVALSYQIKD